MFSWLGVVALLATFLCSSCQWQIEPRPNGYRLTGTGITAAGHRLQAQMTDHFYLPNGQPEDAAVVFRFLRGFFDRHYQEIESVQNNNNRNFVSRSGWTKMGADITLEIAAAEAELFQLLSGGNAYPPRQMVEIQRDVKFVNYVNVVTWKITHCGPFGANHGIWDEYSNKVTAYRDYISGMVPGVQDSLRTALVEAYRYVQQIPLAPGAWGRPPTLTLQHNNYNAQVRRINHLRGIVGQVAQYQLNALPNLQFMPLNYPDWPWPKAGSGVWDLQDLTEAYQITLMLKHISRNAPAAGA